MRFTHRAVKNDKDILYIYVLFRVHNICIVLTFKWIDFKDFSWKQKCYQNENAFAVKSWETAIVHKTNNCIIYILGAL